jgi:hypothetical protein
MIRIATMAFAGAIAFPSLAQQIEFKGVPLGAAKSELLQRFPSLECRPLAASLSSLGEEHCTERLTCSEPACAESRKALSTYAGMPAWDVSFGIVAGRVERFAIVFPARNYVQVRDAAKAIYGAGQESARTMQTRAGAALESRVWSADADGTMLVSEHGTRIDEGGAGAESSTFRQWRASRSKSDTKKNANDM